MSFKDLGLNDNLLKAIEDCGYDTPTPIQAEAIPHVLMMRDVVGVAQTGTGKTAGFVLPMIEILASGRARARMPRSLVLSPTRELAAQIAADFETYGKYSKLDMALLTGGVSMDEQIKKLERGVDVLIATPGRLIDLFERGRILLSDIKILVIDEADRMLDMGFIPDIEKIISLLSPMRQTLLFSATMPPEIQKLTHRFQNNPREVSVSAPASTAKNVEQFVLKTTPRKKKADLLALIKKEKPENAFIFCNRKRDIGELRKFLDKEGFNVAELHGDMAQRSRTQTLQDMRDGKIDLLICSDVAGRGIDIDDLSHVFNYDVPHNSDDYVHRIGRTGRAGSTGRAWTLATDKDQDYLADIEKLINQKIPEGDTPSQQEKPSQRTTKPSSKKSSKSSKKPQKAEKSGGTRNSKGSGKSGKPGKSGASEDAPLGFGDDVPNFFG